MESTFKSYLEWKGLVGDENGEMELRKRWEITKTKYV